MTTLVVATTNPGKVREIEGMLEGAPVALRTLADFPPVEEPEETGSTFAENARLKALYYAERLGLPCVADDSGLEIDALGGLPGVHSARWEGSDYAVKFARIRERLAEAGLETSAARFVCRVALAEGGRILFESEGTVEGTIAPAPRGTLGFGYDPIFYYPPLGRTLGEVPRDEKATVSHRGQAFGALRRFLADRPAPSGGAVSSRMVANPYADALGTRDPLDALAATPIDIRTHVERWGDDHFERSYDAGKWTARQILIHLAQTELALTNRARMALAVSGYVAQPFDQDAWMPADATAEAREALEAYLALRRFNLAMWRTLAPGQLDRTFTHPQFGELTVGWVRAQIAGHELHHLRQLERIK